MRPSCSWRVPLPRIAPVASPVAPPGASTAPASAKAPATTPASVMGGLGSCSAVGLTVLGTTCVAEALHAAASERCPCNGNGTSDCILHSMHRQMLQQTLQDLQEAAPAGCMMQVFDTGVTSRVRLTPPVTPRSQREGHLRHCSPHLLSPDQPSRPLLWLPYPPPPKLQPCARGASYRSQVGGGDAQAARKGCTTRTCRCADHQAK